MTEHLSAGQTPTVDQQLIAAVRDGDVSIVTRMLDRDPALVRVRAAPYGWTPLHAAAQTGQLPVVDLLLRRGADVNAREDGDHTYPLHWAAAAGHLAVVQRLVDAGGDVIGTGDDHELQVIGWASCWNGCDDDAHRAVVDYLVKHGAAHHIFSAIAVNDASEVRRIVARDPSTLEARMSRNEMHQRPLHFAVRHRRPAMVQLLIELGADPAGADDFGYRASAYATTPDVDRAVAEALRERGKADLVALLALRDWVGAGQLLRSAPNSWGEGAAGYGALHLMAKRGDLIAVNWLLANGADPNLAWPHWDAKVVPLHLAVMCDHADIVRALVSAGADPSISDSKHDSDALDWARFFERWDILRALDQRARS